MPTYEYKCNACGKTSEVFHSISAKPLKKCPACGKNALERLIGTGAAIVFKGSGFYQTDYRSESYKKAAEAESKSASGGNGSSGAGSEGKAAESKAAESKPAAGAAEPVKPASSIASASPARVKVSNTAAGKPKSAAKGGSRSRSKK